MTVLANYGVVAGIRVQVVELSEDGRPMVQLVAQAEGMGPPTLPPVTLSPTCAEALGRIIEIAAVWAGGRFE